VNMAYQHNSFYLTAVTLRNKVLVQQIIGAIFAKSHYRPSTVAADPWLDSMIRENKIPVPETSLNALMFEFKNAILAYKQDYINNLSDGYDDVREKQINLIELIGKEYHLD
jgi:hypothetical protein